MGFCPTCDVLIPEESRIEHARSDWHVYNLKRVVANLPPIEESIFNEKKNFFSTEKPVSDNKTYCEACRKVFSNNRSYATHAKSKKHLQNVELKVNAPPRHIKATTDFEPPHPIPLGSCLFCDRHLEPDTTIIDEEQRNQSLARRVLSHMFDSHNFTVPFEEKLRDASGLLIELGRIVGEERCCLACGRQFYGRRMGREQDAQANGRISLAAVRQHMLDKSGHMRVWCGEEDPLKVSLAVAEHEEHVSEGRSSSPPPSISLAGGELFSKFYDNSSVASAYFLPDEDDAYEVRLPSGTTIGHRTLCNIYKQRVPIGPSESNGGIQQRRLPTCNSQRNHALMSAHQVNVLRWPIRPILDKLTRASERQMNENKHTWDLTTGLQGNLVYRGHLRRQY